MCKELFQPKESYVERVLRLFEESQEIACPYCEHIQSAETTREHFSIEGGDLDCMCGACERVFLVTEDVERTFTVSRMPDFEKAEDDKEGGKT